MLEATGIHVFAGGFTLGVNRVMNVTQHLEVHDLGAETARQRCGVDVVRCDAKDWPETSGVLAYGNPRCTAFSSLTGRCSSHSHGPYGHQTRDLVELCTYAAGKFDFVVAESVQQAFTTGRPLLSDIYRDVFKPKHYRVAHLFINASSFGNPQRRKRYFMVAYRDCYKFNIQPPNLLHRDPVLWDAIGHFEEAVGHESKDIEGPDSCWPLTDVEREAVKRMPNGWGLNAMGAYAFDRLPETMKDVWTQRNSDKPFSLYGPFRLRMSDPSPTLHSGSKKWVHPNRDRTLTVREMTAIMGWPNGAYPIGEDAAGQLGKGIVPAVGEWLAQQVSLSFQRHWGGEDFESYYDPHDCVWYGESDASGKGEKEFDMTRYLSPFDVDLPEFVMRPSHPAPDVEGLPRRLKNAL